MPEPVRVFVSHHHSAEEDEITAQLVKDLEAAGAQVWVDVSDVGADDIMDRVNTALANSDWFVLVVTPEAIASIWVKWEVHAAFKLKAQGRLRGVIQIMAKPIPANDIPPILGTHAYFDAITDYDQALIKTLRELGLSKITPVPAPQDEIQIRVADLIDNSLLKRIAYLFQDPAAQDAAASSDTSPPVESEDKAFIGQEPPTGAFMETQPIPLDDGALDEVDWSLDGETEQYDTGKLARNRVAFAKLFILPPDQTRAPQPYEVVLRGTSVSVGRSSSRTVVLENDKAVSRVHAMLRYGTGGYAITDEQSENGTFVNGEKIRTSTRLRYGDLIAIGKHLIEYQWVHP